MRGLRVKRLIVCGVVGVVATVLSAWGLETYGGMVSDFTEIQRGIDDGGAWPVPAPSEWGVPEYTEQHSSWYRSLRMSYGPIMSQNDQCLASMLRAKVGWPMHSLELRGGAVSPVHNSNGSVVAQVHEGPYNRGIPVDNIPFRRGRTDLPLRPVWPGFAVNASFYAGVCWVLLFAPGVVVRWRRRRRGRCAACGYDLSGLEACPECGA